jgi:hypothetical protein
MVADEFNNLMTNRKCQDIFHLDFLLLSPNFHMTRSSSPCLDTHEEQS